LASVTFYCVQPFWNDRAKLAHGTLRQFKHRDRALRAGEAAARQVGGAIVYSVEGDPEFQTWSAPRLLAKHGAVPAISF
jgi:hypothetical protein